MPKTVTAKQYNAKFKKVHKRWTELMADHNPDALRIGNSDELYWDSAIVGIGRQHGSETVFIYDHDKLTGAMYNYLCAVVGKDYSDAYEGAVEWVDYNIADAYMGKGTPIIMYRNLE